MPTPLVNLTWSSIPIPVSRAYYATLITPPFEKLRDPYQPSMLWSLYVQIKDHRGDGLHSVFSQPPSIFTRCIPRNSNGSINRMPSRLNRREVIRKKKPIGPRSGVSD